MHTSSAEQNITRWKWDPSMHVQRSTSNYIEKVHIWNRYNPKERLAKELHSHCSQRCTERPPSNFFFITSLNLGTQTTIYSLPHAKTHVLLLHVHHRIPLYRRPASPLEIWLVLSPFYNIFVTAMKDTWTYYSLREEGQVYFQIIVYFKTIFPCWLPRQKSFTVSLVVLQHNRHFQPSITYKAGKLINPPKYTLWEP